MINITQSSWLVVNGKHFKCEKCGVELFHKEPLTKGFWVCNGCGTMYVDDTYEEAETYYEFITKDIKNLAYILSEIVNMDNPPFRTYQEAAEWLLKVKG